jgi:hypothetical protein
MPPCFSLRDWYERGKSSHPDRKFSTIYLPTPVSPFHAEPLQLPLTYTVSIDVELRVFDNEREQSLNLLTTGLSTAREVEPYRTSGDSSVHRYVAGGEICEVPHDRCPQCWGSWDCNGSA